MGTGWWRCTQMLACTTRSALANTASMSPIAISPRKATLSSSSSNSGGFDGVEGVVVGDDRVEHLDVLDDQLERVLGDVAVSATTSAIGSPT